MQGEYVLSSTPSAKNNGNSHRLIDVKESGDEFEVPLASPDLYIIVNCKPTKEKVVWRSL